MDTTIIVYATVKVLVADWHDRPHEAAAEVVRHALCSAAHPTHDWGGSFAIIEADRFSVSAPFSSD